MTITIYDVDDNIITVLSDKKSVNAFLNGYLSIEGCDHYIIES
jgi:hypothetical protein